MWLQPGVEGPAQSRCLVRCQYSLSPGKGACCSLVLAGNPSLTPSCEGQPSAGFPWGGSGLTWVVQSVLLDILNSIFNLVFMQGPRNWCWDRDQHLCLGWERWVLDGWCLGGGGVPAVWGGISCVLRELKAARMPQHQDWSRLCFGSTGSIKTFHNVWDFFIYLKFIYFKYALAVQEVFRQYRKDSRISFANEIACTRSNTVKL